MLMEEISCEGCPVYNETGKLGCGGTPYEKWWKYQDQHGFTRTEKSLRVFNSISKIYATEFFKFLIDLKEKFEKDLVLEEKERL